MSSARSETTRVRPVGLETEVAEWFTRRASFTVVRDAGPDSDVVVTSAGAEDSLTSEPESVVAYGGSGRSADAVVPRGPADSHVRLARTVRAVADHDPVAFPVPDDDADRIRALARYDFDSPNLAAHLDALATAVKESLDARAGFIGVLDDDTEHFLAADGVNWDTLPREDAICSYGVLHDSSLAISELRADDRVSYDAISDEFDPEFYAGAPLRTSDGHTLGMVCVMDDEPREFTDADDRALTWFADQIVTHVETRGAD